jgi:hypothetical protein
MILSCAFCGSTPTLIYRKTFKEYFVACSDKSCQAMPGRIWGGPENNKFISRTKQEAIDRWNRIAVRKEVKLEERII